MFAKRARCLLARSAFPLLLALFRLHMFLIPTLFPFSLAAIEESSPPPLQQILEIDQQRHLVEFLKEDENARIMPSPHGKFGCR